MPRQTRRARPMLAGARAREGGAGVSRTGTWVWGRRVLAAAGVLALTGACVAQREDASPEEIASLEAKWAEGRDVGEVVRASWHTVGEHFQVNLEAASSCDGLLRRTQSTWVRAWVSYRDDPDGIIPILSPRVLELRLYTLDGLFEGVSDWDFKRDGHVRILSTAIDGNILSDPCGCVTVSALADGFARTRLIAKRLICPEGAAPRAAEAPVAGGDVPAS